MTIEMFRWLLWDAESQLYLDYPRLLLMLDMELYRRPDDLALSPASILSRDKHSVGIV